MLKLMIEPKPIVLCCSITMPHEIARALSLNCYNAGKATNREDYVLSKEDGKKLIQYVKDAPASQFVFHCFSEGKFGENNFREVLQEYNRTHKKKIGWDDLVQAVKSITMDKNYYRGSKVSQTTNYKTKYDNGVFHEWKLPLSVLFDDTSKVDETIPGRTDSKGKDALYIKLFVPDDPKQKGKHKGVYTEPDEVQVASFHRNSDSQFFGQNKQKDDAEHQKLGEAGYRAKRKQRSEETKKHFKSMEDRYGTQVAAQTQNFNKEYGNPEMVDGKPFSIDD